MKTLLTLFFLFFSPLVFAEDISNYEIEGMSVGSNLLNYYTKDEIKKNLRKNAYSHITEKNKFFHTEFSDNSFDVYDFIQISYKIKNNNLYEIAMIAGGIVCDNKIELCINKQDEIANDFKSIFSDFPLEKVIYKTHNADVHEIIYEIPSGQIRLQVVEWSEEIVWKDNIRVVLMSNEFDNWLY